MEKGAWNYFISVVFIFVGKIKWDEDGKSLQCTRTDRILFLYRYGCLGAWCLWSERNAEARMQPWSGHNEIFSPVVSTGRWTKEVTAILLCPFTTVICKAKLGLWFRKLSFLLHLTLYAGSPDLTSNCFIKACPQLVTLGHLTSF